MAERLWSKKCLVSLVLMSLLCISAVTAKAVEMQVGIVDFQKVIENSSAYQNIRSQLDKKADEFRTNAAGMEEKLQKEQQELESKKSVYSSEVYTNKRKALEKEVESYQEKFHTKRLSLDKASSQAMSVLEKNFFEVVENNAKARGLSVILASSSVLYSDTALDVTEAITEELNKKLPSFTVTFEESTNNKAQNTGGEKQAKEKNTPAIKK